MEDSIDIMMCAEKHHRFVANTDISSFLAYDLNTAKRGFGEKQGGRKLIVVKKTLNHMLYKPILPADRSWVDDEQMWILVFTGNVNLAIYSIYMAAEIAGRDGS